MFLQECSERFCSWVVLSHRNKNHNIWSLNLETCQSKLGPPQTSIPYVYGPRAVVLDTIQLTMAVFLKLSHFKVYPSTLRNPGLWYSFEARGRKDVLSIKDISFPDRVQCLLHYIYLSCCMSSLLGLNHLYHMYKIVQEIQEMENGTCVPMDPM